MPEKLEIDNVTVLRVDVGEISNSILEIMSLICFKFTWQEAVGTVICWNLEVMPELGKTLGVGVQIWKPEPGET